jgi:SM-20-related protein
MQSSFEDLISSFLENKIGISNSFLSNDLALKLKTNLLTLYKQKDLKAASIGNDYLLNTDDTIRRDKIF